MKVCIVGLGKIGLPLAAKFAEQGMEVIGAEVSQKVVDSVNAGLSHIKEEPGLEEKVKAAQEKCLLRATTDTVSAVSESEVTVVIVPLYVDDEKKPDYSILDSATKEVAKGLEKGSEEGKKGKLVIYETTVPIGTTSGRMKELLEEESGLKAGDDFFLAHSPERVNSNTIFKNLEEYPKVVGGLDTASGEKTTEFYKKALGVEVLNTGSCEAAEMVKLCGMTFRDANIAIANSFARVADAYGIDVLKVIKTCNTIPHTNILYPGIGVGGHCAPVYPHFMVKNAKDKEVEIPVVSASREENDGMSGFALGKVSEALGGLRGARVLLLGVAYREDVKETAFATSLLLIDKLKEENARVYAHDPLFSDEEIHNLGAESVSLEKLPPLDAVVLVSYHQQYKDGLNLGAFTSAGAKVFLDGRNVFRKQEVEGAGMKYIGIGRE